MIWCCKECRPKVRLFLDNIEEVENKLNSIDKRIDDLKEIYEERFERIENKLNLTKCDTNGNKIDELQKNMDSKLESITEQLNTSVQATNKLETKSFADLFTGNEKSNQPANLVKSLAIQVANSQKKILTSREERENNIIVYNVPEESTTNIKDDSFFKSLCKDHLQLGDIETKQISRLETRSVKPQPMKVVFNKNWEKRKFLSNMYKIKDDDNLGNIRVRHDMNKEDREENRRLIKEADSLNDKEQPKDFKYRVRGPPWDMKIVKAFPYKKN